MRPTKIEPPQISDEQLLCYYWNEGLSAAVQSQIHSLLSQDAALAARFSALQSDLLRLKQTGEHKLSGAAGVRIRRALAARANAPECRALPYWQWAAPLLAASFIAIAIFIKPSVNLVPSTEVAGAANAKPVMTTPSDQVLRALQVHLSDSEMLLENFNPNDAASADLLAEIIAQNQSFERRAKAQGRSDLARVLRAMEPVLRALGNAQGVDSRENLLEQLEFEAKSLQTKLPTLQSKQASTFDVPTSI